MLDNFFSKIIVSLCSLSSIYIIITHISVSKVLDVNGNAYHAGLTVSAPAAMSVKPAYFLPFILLLPFLCWFKPSHIQITFIHQELHGTPVQRKNLSLAEWRDVSSSGGT